MSEENLETQVDEIEEVVESSVDDNGYDKDDIRSHIAAELDKLEEIINQPDFWSTPEKSQKVMQDRKRLEEQLAQDSKISLLTDDLDTLFELGKEGENITNELEREIKNLSGYLERLETQMLLSGENDSRSAIVTIHPGAGGTESQDWAEMLLRMYLRWGEAHGFSACRSPDKSSVSLNLNLLRI